MSTSSIAVILGWEVFQVKRLRRSSIKKNHGCDGHVSSRTIAVGEAGWYDADMAKILVAGEYGAVLSVLESEIQGEGHDVVTASTGQDAYELTLSERPAAVFLGTRMAVFDGLTTCAMIRDDPETPRDLPVFLVVSDDLSPKTLEKAGVTEVIRERHEAWELRELLARYPDAPHWDAV